MKLKGDLEPKVFAQLMTFPVSVTYESVQLPYTIVENRRYIPDFIVETPSGRTLYLEVKGYFRPDDRKKLAAVREAHPEKDIRLVFKTDNKLNAKSPTRYSDWCKKHGWTYAVGPIPEEWMI